ncbi:clathrin light chain [Nannochloropsis oceanica]
MRYLQSTGSANLDAAPASYAELDEMPTELPSTSALDAFLEEWERKLDAKRGVENEKRSTVIEKARAELAKFAEEREEMREKKQSANRKEEQVKLEKLEADLEAENPWERVISLIDMQTDVGGPESPSCDLQRLKQMLIQLKAEPLGEKK